MYFGEQQEYMSEPIDQMSESSYIKINKRFLQELKQANQIDDLSRYRQDSDIEDDSKSQQHEQDEEDLSQMREQGTYQNSPIKSNFYKDVIENNHQPNDSILKSSPSKRKQPHYLKESKEQTPQEKRQFYKQTEKISKLSNFQRKQVYTPFDNTFEYYLLRKSHDRKQKESQILPSELNTYNEMNQMQTKPQLFSPKHQLSASKRVPDQKSQFQRINYKKLLQNEISKNKQLQRHIYKLESRLGQLTLLYDQSTKSTKKMQKELNTAQKVRKQNKNRMKELDGKLEGLKNVCKVKNTQNYQLTIQLKKQNKTLKDENQKYRLFTQTLAESIFVLKGKKPKKLEDIWSQWKQIFESFSKNKWTLNKTKSSNRRA